MPEPTEPTPETPRPAMTMREIRHALGHRIEQPGPEQYVVTVNQLARILNSTSSHQTPWRAWPNLTDEERDAYESTAACELADYGIRPLAPAGAPHSPQDAAGTVGAGTETPGSGTGPQNAAQTFGDVQGRCPACGGESLFLGDGGYVTCRRLSCPTPDAASTLLEQRPATRAAEAAGLRERIADALEGADYRPGMRRGDLADAVLPAVHRYTEQLAAGRETWRRRAEEIEADRDRLARTVDRMRRTNRMVNGTARAARERAEQAEATMQRVLDELDALDDHINADHTPDPEYDQGLRHTVARIRAALAASATPQ